MGFNRQILVIGSFRSFIDSKEVSLAAENVISAQPAFKYLMRIAI